MQVGCSDHPDWVLSRRREVPGPPAGVQQELSYLAPITRVLTPRSAVSSFNWSANFLLTLEEKTGRMVMANPGVTLVEVALSEYHSPQPRQGRAEPYQAV